MVCVQAKVLASTFMSCLTYHPNIGPDCCALPDVGKLGLRGTKEPRGLQNVNAQADSCAGALGATSEKQKWKTQGRVCGCWPCRSRSDRGGCDGNIGSKPGWTSMTLEGGCVDVSQGRRRRQGGN